MKNGPSVIKTERKVAVLKGSQEEERNYSKAMGFQTGRRKAWDLLLSNMNMLTLLRYTRVKMVNKLHSKCSYYHLNAAKNKGFFFLQLEKKRSLCYDLFEETKTEFVAIRYKLELTLEEVFTIVCSRMMP